MSHKRNVLALDRTFTHVGVDALRSGMLLQADGGFTCLRQNAVRRVRADYKGAFFIKCACGRHYLDGNFDQGECVGFAEHPK